MTTDTPTSVPPTQPAPIPTATLLDGTVREIPGIPFVYVSAGEFEMGSESEYADIDEQVHTVDLDNYWIMKTEVTNAQYAKCVAPEACREPDNDHWDDGQFSDHPVTHVSWDDAVVYAEWLSKESGQTVRLPTEAEWEKAARGVDGRIYPWGDDWDQSLVNYCDRNCEFDQKDEDGDDRFATTAPVGAYSSGASPYGVLDMAGNVWEWTADWYDSGYFANSPVRNPPGAEPDTSRVVRGGSWVNSPNYVRAANRRGLNPGYRVKSLGFRLVSPGF